MRQQEKAEIERRLKELEAVPEYRDHPLMGELRWLAERYAKVERQLRKVSRIGDLLQDLLRETSQEFEHASLTDPLTELPNRRAMWGYLQAEANRAEREGGSLAIAIGDIDHFKQINDKHGHSAGDSALRLLAGWLHSELRDYDQCARWGGEEFLLLFPGLEEAEAKAAAERVRDQVAQAAFPWHEADMTLTISFGIAALGSAETVDALLIRADNALYSAKQAGRNRVASWSLSGDSKGNDSRSGLDSET